MKHHLGIPWYGPSDWHALRAVAVDPDELESSYDEWLRLCSQSCAELSADGIDVKRIHIDAAELIRWCRERRIPLDARARAHFASENFHRAHHPPAPAPGRATSSGRSG
jgi:hypothetical protein